MELIRISTLINWNLYFKCINCDLGQKVVRGDPSVSHKICTHQEEKVLHLVAFRGVGGTSGCALSCRSCVWLRPENLVDGDWGPGCVWRCGYCVWLCPENLESSRLRPDAREMRRRVLIRD